MTSRAAKVKLLDANLLIALVVDDHVHHGEAERWWTSTTGSFVTCPITQGTLVRFLVREGASGEAARRFLSDVLAHERHLFWPDDLGYDRVDLGAVVGHRQVTDAYLAGLARAHGGRLATLDRGLAAVHPDVVDLVGS
ncbi:MAG TPA: TA system VapC family ribonuclease toxin [Acidimicrobiales bacterium]|nr:TA system VapC family ribonuclease toxin [Acidimicrobiales bacterium]